MVKKSQLPIKSLESIKSTWQAAKELDPRNRFKALRQITFGVVARYKIGNKTLQELNFYVEILQSAIHMPNPPASCSRTLAKIIADRVELTGNQNAVIRSKLTGKVPVESGSVIIGDPSIMTIPLNHKFFYFVTP